MENLILEVADVGREIGMLQMQCLAQVLKADNIHFGQLSVLGELLAAGQCTQCELAERLEVSRASIGVSLKRLERAGLINRQTDPKDQRRNTVTLTEEGKEAAVRAGQILSELTFKKLRGFSGAEIGQYLKAQKRIRANLAEYLSELSQKEGYR